MFYLLIIVKFDYINYIIKSKDSPFFLINSSYIDIEYILLY